jgi:LCP family protein required for cell wall assembly
MKKMSPFRKRFWPATLAVLSIVVVGGTLFYLLLGFYQFYQAADRIYEPSPARIASPLESRYHHPKSSENSESTEKAKTHRTHSYPEPEPEQTTEPAESSTDTEVQAQSEETQPEQPKAEPKSLLPFLDKLKGEKSNKVETFLLLGVDSRGRERARSDTILLAMVPESGGQIQLLSIPRDTRAHVPGHGYTKINHAMTYGGVPLIKKSVENFLKVPIDHTITLDFEAFRKVVDELGGLPVVVEKNMNYDDPTDGTSIHLSKGQTLKNGKEALDYARFRADAEADTGRMRRQQQVIRAIIQRGGEPAQWRRLFTLTSILGDHLKTDLPPREWARLALYYGGASAEQVTALKLNGVNRISPYDNLWYFYVEDAERERISRQLNQLRRGNG